MAQLPDTEAPGKRAEAGREERGEEGSSRSEEETRGASPELEDRGGRTAAAEFHLAAAAGPRVRSTPPARSTALHRAAIAAGSQYPGSALESAAGGATGSVGEGAERGTKEKPPPGTG